MKKVIMSLAFLMVFSATLAAAGDLGNPVQLIKQGIFDVGFQWTSRFKQGFEDYDLKRAYPVGHPDSERKGADFENDQYYMTTFTYGVIDQINVFAKLGIGGRRQMARLRAWQQLEGGPGKQFHLGHWCQGKAL